MAQRRTTLIDPPIEDLLDKVDSKFTLVSLSAKRARQINSYYNQLGEGMGMVIPPQVASVSGKPLTIAFEEIAATKVTYHHPEPGADEAESDEAEAESDEAEAESDEAEDGAGEGSAAGTASESSVVEAAVAEGGEAGEHVPGAQADAVHGLPEAQTGE
ncbi:MAG: DNA-directed RNA polymerase subunit omega [Acidimicrobiales bacterium]|jgi:DNA-directed RNA polymerase subunit omega